MTHTALTVTTVGCLVGPVDPRPAEEGVEPVVGTHQGEAFRLGTVAALQHPHHRRLQVVVAHPPGDAAEVLERQHVTLEERLLRLRAERDVERTARVRQPHHEHPALHPRAADGGVELTEVDLTLGAGQVGLRDRDLAMVQAELDPAPRHVARHRHLRHLRAVLSDQPLPDPPGGMALLARRVTVSQQPAVDHRGPRVDRRTLSRGITLSRGRLSRLQCLSHRPPVHLVPLGQLADRQLILTSIPPDLLEQFHP